MHKYLQGANISIANMNWSIVVIGAIIILPGIYWITHARHVYTKESNTTIESGHPAVEGRSQSVDSMDGKH
jgi:choline transport protein